MNHSCISCTCVYTPMFTISYPKHHTKKKQTTQPKTNSTVCKLGLSSIDLSRFRTAWGSFSRFQWLHHVSSWQCQKGNIKALKLYKFQHTYKDVGVNLRTKPWFSFLDKNVTWKITYKIWFLNQLCSEEHFHENHLYFFSYYINDKISMSRKRK